KKVQHPTGGVVKEIRVSDGSHVRQGDVLLALDPTQATANYAIVGTAVDELTTRQARLQAERDGQPLVWTREVLTRSSDPTVRYLMSEEKRLYDLHTQANKGQKDQLRQRIEQLKQQIIGDADQIEAKEREIQLIGPELEGIRKLYNQQLVPLTRLNSLERASVELRGDIAQLNAASAEAKGRIAETELQIIQVDQNARSQAGNELTDVQNRLAELRQRKVTAEQEYSRVLIRAPQDGVVDKLAAHTVGGVISPGEPIMFIVPDKDILHVEAKIRPTDVDQVRQGEKAMMRFSAFNVRRTPEIAGEVDRVSAEVHTDERNGAAYYVVDITIPTKELAKLGGLKLVPGMPVESFIQTEKRTMLSYLTRPLLDQLKRAFREQ
ncbi:MAG: HlyD family type I secretion periplasmic adaptor subunit, partial [Phenylobacterium sp.]